MNMRFNETERDIDINTTDVFYVDGFHRQANNTLRRLILDCFPTISINKPLKHTVQSFSEAFKENYIVLATVRHPAESINSLCGYKNIKPEDRETIIEIINFYNYIYKYLMDNKNKIHFVHFNQIINNPVTLLKFMKKEFNIKEDNIEKYKDIKITPFFTSFNKDGVDNHNLTSNLDNKLKLQWIFDTQEYIGAVDIYDKILKEIIELGK